MKKRSASNSSSNAKKKNTTKLVLAGDLGGTRARFALFEAAANGTAAPHLVHQNVLESRSFKTFEAALEQFLSGSAKDALGKKVSVVAASIGIAGPVVDQRVKTTNLPWTIDARVISKTFKIPSVTLLNDLVAGGLGAMASPSNKLSVVHKGRPKKNDGTIAVIAAGTGLGEAVFVWDADAKKHVPCATEGSHVDFAPRNAVEEELLAMLRAEYGHVSYERVASGSTIAKLYHFFVRERGIKESKDAQTELARAEDPNIAVVELAESGRSEAAMCALDLWASVYGAEAGNLALKSLASGGVYVCGGVSARLAKILAEGLPKRSGGSSSTKKKSKSPTRTSPFVEAFLDKGRMRPVLEDIPVAVCCEPRAGLLGAATHAASRA